MKDRKGTTNLWTADSGNLEGVPPVSQHVNVDLPAFPPISLSLNIVQQRVFFCFPLVQPRPEKLDYVA